MIVDYVHHSTLRLSVLERQCCPPEFYHVSSHGCPALEAPVRLLFQGWTARDGVNVSSVCWWSRVYTSQTCLWWELE